MIRSGLIIAAALLLVSAFPLGAAEEAPSPSYPDPRRFEEDILAFEAADQIAAPPSGAVLCIGSSSMRFWHGTMAHDLEPLTLIPRGFGGSTMLDVLFYSSRVVVPYTPRAILLYEGDNDMDFGISPARFLATFQQFREVVRATLPETRLYVLAIKPSPARWDIWPHMAEANGLLRRVCEGDSMLTYIDIATPMRGEDGLPLPGLFLEDRLHLNELGYEIWAREVRRVMVKIEADHE